MFEIISFMILLQVKHWYIDFVNQNDAEVKSKGVYGDWTGVGHSAKHGLGTAIVTVIAFGPGYLFYALTLALVDFSLHYHIDWAKMNWGNRDITTKTFWAHLGLDQMLHQLTYILFIVLAT